MGATEARSAERRLREHDVYLHAGALELRPMTEDAGP